MQQILDLHIHSKYSRACSRDLTLENIDATCRIKGVDIVATGDFTHPDWFSAIKNELVEIENSGLYRLRFSLNNEVYPVKSREAGIPNNSGLFNGVKFILSTEFALIYKDGDKVRRIHLVLHAPNIKAVEELNKYLDKRFNIRSDGRPILGMSAPELVKLCLTIHPKFLIYPAHIWTPWFSVFGSKSGFDSLEECFHGETKNIYAYETGLSSDPEMNWRLTALDKLTLLSNSDAHSPQNIGREANVFELSENPTFDKIYEAIKNPSASSGHIKYTIEFYPEEGMYHYDGHRFCGVSFSPEETKRKRGICPICKKPLTIGVLNRVEELADRPVGFKPVEAPGYRKLVELDKIIAEALDVKSRRAKKVKEIYNNAVKELGSELDILLNVSLLDIKKAVSAAVAEGVGRVREGNLIIKPGFDGQYGEVRIFNEEEKEKNKQLKLF